MVLNVEINDLCITDMFDNTQQETYFISITYSTYYWCSIWLKYKQRNKSQNQKSVMQTWMVLIQVFYLTVVSELKKGGQIKHVSTSYSKGGREYEFWHFQNYCIKIITTKTNMYSQNSYLFAYSQRSLWGYICWLQISQNGVIKSGPNPHPGIRVAYQILQPRS